jgi:hypothetical protein
LVLSTARSSSTRNGWLRSIAIVNANVGGAGIDA